MCCKPFIKWVGGKQILAERIAEHIPAFEKYHEPFVGGGALFFHLYNTGRIKEASLSDTNVDLIVTYEAIQESVDGVIYWLNQHQKNNCEEYYYEVREDLPEDSCERAARFIYLNKTCFNGLYRVNKAGFFNASYGKYNNPLICDEQNLKAVSEALQCAVINAWHYSMVVPGQRDFVYCDPPYDGTFTRYTRGGFDSDNQTHLRDTVVGWDCPWMVSNSDTPLIRGLYAGFDILEIETPRRINSDGKGRGRVVELLIKNEKNSVYAS